MKKILAIALAVVMTMAMSVTAFAAEATLDAAGSVEITTKGVYNNNTETAADVIAVDIVWDDMTFTYNAEGALEYNPDKMWDEKAGQAGWKNETKKITISNRSNVGITASSAYSGGYLTVSNTDSALTIDKATPGDASKNAAGTASVGEITVTPASSAQSISAETNLGNITLTIAKTETQQTEN